MMNDDERLLADINLLISGDNDPELLLARGLTYRRLQRFKEALLDFSTLIHQGFSEVAKYRGECYLKQGDMAKAEQDLAGFVVSHPNDPFALRHLAELHRLCDQWDKATRLFEKSVTLDPDNLFAISGLADCYRHLGLSDRAIQLFDLVLTTDPFHSQALAGRAAILKERGSHDEAREGFRLAIMEDPRNEFACDGLQQAK